MQEKQIVALYDHFADAKAAVAEIIQAGAPGDRIALLANDSNGDHPSLSINPAYAREQFDEDSTAQPGIITGAEIGIGLGGVLAFLATVAPFSIPGVDALVAQGTLITIVVGAVVGGVIGALIGFRTDHRVSAKDVELYAEGLKRGGTLLTTIVPADAAAKLSAILKAHSPAALDERPAEWTAEGWVSLDVGHIGGPGASLAPA
jgi:hypothetical protein